VPVGHCGQWRLHRLVGSTDQEYGSPHTIDFLKIILRQYPEMILLRLYNLLKVKYLNGFISIRKWGILFVTQITFIYFYSKRFKALEK